MNKSKNSYVIMTENMLPRSNIIKDCILAFLVGGSICCGGQLISDIFTSLGIAEATVKMLTPSTLVFLGGFLTAIGVYDDIGKFAGAGSVVPITGFANSIVSSALEFKREGYIFGMGAKMFNIAGPVIVFGTAASVIYGIIYYIFSRI